MILQSSRLLRTNSATSKPELPRSMISSRIRSGHSWLMAAMAALHVAALRICSGGVLMVATLLVIKAVTAKKHAGVFAEMAEADKVLYNK